MSHYLAPVNLSVFCKACLVLFLTFLPVYSQAASLFVSPQSGVHEVGSTFPVDVLVNSSDIAFNAVSGKLSFPATFLEVVSITKSKSSISLWVQEPSFSNIDGDISFEGVMLNPGYKGSAGNVVTINFRVKKAGEAKLNFLNGEILANDGIGTSILSNLVNASYSLRQAKVIAPLPKKEVEKEVQNTEIENTNNEATSSETIVSSNASSSVKTNITENTELAEVPQGTVEENFSVNNNQEANNVFKRITIILYLIILALALVTLLSILIFYIWKFFGGLKKSVKREIDDAEKVISKEVSDVGNEIDEHTQV